MDQNNVCYGKGQRRSNTTEKGERERENGTFLSGIATKDVD